MHSKKMTPALRKRLQHLLSVLSILLVIALLAAGWAWWQVRGSLPQLDGTLNLSGLSAPVKIERDALGTPTITGTSRIDVARATGFAHAQDRFFQMDLQRRRAAGELSELFGKATLNIDRNARLHGFRRIATQVIAQATPTERALLQAYTEGINAGLASLNKKPWEYIMLRLEPQPWREEDSILTIYAMWFDLQDHHATMELNNDALRRALGQSALNFFAPRGDSWDAALDGSTFEPAPLPAFRFKSANSPLATTAAPTSSPEAHAKQVVGSNAFALSGAHTATGAALLASDMHLDLKVPHIWYRAALRWTDGETTHQVTGVTLPGTPLVVAGSNRHVAWGFTNAYIDTTDLLITELDAIAQTFYRTPNGWLPVEERNEEILVKGEEPVTELVRWTQWGPVVGNADDGRFHVLRWTAHDAEATNLHFMAIENARTTTEAISIAHQSGIPPENAIFADADGNVAWTIIGKIPNRIGYDGRMPVAWTYGDRRWDGWLPSEQIPVYTSNPVPASTQSALADGIVWTGNNRPVGGEAYAKLGDANYDGGARARQLRDTLRALVSSGKKATSQDLLGVQLDDRALFLERWQQFFLEVLTDDAIAHKKARGELRDLVRQWNGHASTDSVAYRLVRAFRAHVAARTFAPFVEQASSRYREFSYRNFHYEDALWQLVHEQPLGLLNPAHRSWESLLLAAADDVLADADKAHVPLKRFTWGARNTLKMQHPIGNFLPGPLANFLAMPADPLPGDTDMPRIQSISFGQSQRLVVSPGHETEGILTMPGGQSGHPLSKFYRAGHDTWVKGEATPLLPGAAQHTLTLTPQ